MPGGRRFGVYGWRRLSAVACGPLVVYDSRNGDSHVAYLPRTKGLIMPRCRKAIIGVAVSLAASLWLIAGDGVAVAQSLPASGRYQCTGGSGTAAALNFAVGPGNIYTTKTGSRGTMVIHPGTGNVLFRDAAPQNAYEGRYSAGPPPQVALVTVTDGNSVDTGIVCQVR